MDKDYKVIDNAKGHTTGYHKNVFFRSDGLKKQVTAIKWFFLTVVEMIVGSELLESFIITGSVPPYGTNIKDDSHKYGKESHLTNHIPAGFFTNLLKTQIIELLYYKFHWHYLILDQVGEPQIDDKKKVIDCTRTRFRAKKDLFYQYIALRRVYDLSWVVFNLAIDLIVFFITTDLELVLISAISVEAIRRILRV